MYEKIFLMFRDFDFEWTDDVNVILIEVRVKLKFCYCRKLIETINLVKAADRTDEKQ